MGAVVIFLFSGLVGALSFNVVSNYETSMQSQMLVNTQVNSAVQELNSDDLLKAELTSAIYLNSSSTLDLIQTFNCYFKPSQTCPAPQLAAWQKNLLTPLSVKGLQNQFITRQVSGISPTTSMDQYIDYLLVNSDPNFKGNPKSTVRLSLGQAVRFNNAVTTNNASCLFCHATIYGNVAQYETINDFPLANTFVHGGYLTAGDISPMDNWGLSATSDPTQLPVYGYPNPRDATSLVPNYLSVDPVTHIDTFYGSSHSKILTANYQGISLPWNVPRQQFMLPKFDPDSALKNARGSATGAVIQLYPLVGVTNASCSGTTNKLASITDCNVIINARDGAPLALSGTVFIRGDVVIFGSVSGQGAIYSGHNIFVTDNLSYVNPSPLFDMSLNSNTAMDQVTANGPALAAAMKPYDELKLFATNNIIIGDPYPEYENGYGNIGTGNVGTNLIYEFENIFTPTAVPTAARDPVTGYMLDLASTSGDGTPCYVYPWGMQNQCVANPAIDYFHQYDGDSQVSDNAYYMDLVGIPTPSAYTNNFYPTNPLPGSNQMSAWITPTAFITATKNAASWAHAAGLDANGRRNHTKVFSFRIPLIDPTGNPYDYNNWMTGAQAVQKFESYIGVDFSKYPTLQHGVRANGDTSTIPLDQRIADFLNSEYAMLKSNGTIGRGGGYVPFMLFSYNSITQVEGRWDPTCADVLYYAVDGETSAGLPPCTTDNSVTPPPLLTANDFFGGDVAIRMGGRGVYPTIYLVTDYWNDAVVRPRNKINLIQATLFANQYVSYANDTLSDDQIVIDGGVVAKQFASIFLNMFGNDRVYSNGYQQTSAAFQPYTDESLIVFQDPRFQYDTELLTTDFGSTLFHIK